MTDITEAKRIALATIPLEAVEAVADIIAVSEHGMPLQSLTRRTQTRIRRSATAALRAGIAAWPGREVFSIMSDGEESIILPLPQENK